MGAHRAPVTTGAGGKGKVEAQASSGPFPPAGKVTNPPPGRLLEQRATRVLPRPVSASMPPLRPVVGMGMQPKPKGPAPRPLGEKKSEPAAPETPAERRPALGASRQPPPKRPRLQSQPLPENVVQQGAQAPAKRQPLKLPPPPPAPSSPSASAERVKANTRAIAQYNKDKNPKILAAHLAAQGLQAESMEEKYLIVLEFLEQMAKEGTSLPAEQRQAFVDALDGAMAEMRLYELKPEFKLNGYTCLRSLAADCLDMLSLEWASIEGAKNEKVSYRFYDYLAERRGLIKQQEQQIDTAVPYQEEVVQQRGVFTAPVSVGVEEEILQCRTHLQAAEAAFKDRPTADTLGTYVQARYTAECTAGKTPVEAFAIAVDAAVKLAGPAHKEEFKTSAWSSTLMDLAETAVLIEQGEAAAGAATLEAFRATELGKYLYENNPTLYAEDTARSTAEWRDLLAAFCNLSVKAALGEAVEPTNWVESSHKKDSEPIMQNPMARQREVRGRSRSAPSTTGVAPQKAPDARRRSFGASVAAFFRRSGKFDKKSAESQERHEVAGGGHDASVRPPVETPPTVAESAVSDVDKAKQRHQRALEQFTGTQTPENLTQYIEATLAYASLIPSEEGTVMRGALSLELKTLAENKEPLSIQKCAAMYVARDAMEAAFKDPSKDLDAKKTAFNAYLDARYALLQAEGKVDNDTLIAAQDICEREARNMAYALGEKLKDNWDREVLKDDALYAAVHTWTMERFQSILADKAKYEPSTPST